MPIACEAKGSSNYVKLFPEEALTTTTTKMLDTLIKDTKGIFYKFL